MAEPVVINVKYKEIDCPRCPLRVDAGEEAVRRHMGFASLLECQAVDCPVGLTRDRVRAWDVLTGQVELRPGGQGG